MLCHFDKTHKRRSLLRLLCLWAMISVAGCELPQKPGELWWDVDLNIPFGVRDYGVWDLADPDTTLRRVGSGIGMEEDSSVYFSAWSDISAPVRDSLYIRPVNVQIERYLTALEAPLGYDTLLGFTLGQLNADVGALHGTTQDVPEHSLDGLYSFPLPFGYDSLEIDTGKIRLVVANRLPYPVTDIEIRAANKVVAEIGWLGSQQQAVIDTALDDAFVRSEFVLTLSGVGSGGQNIAIDSTDRVTLSVQLDTVTASRFYGIVPEQSVQRDSAFAIDQQHDVTVAIIAAGNLIVTLGNHSQFADSVTLRIPNLISRLNDTLRVTRFLQPGDSDIVTISLEQYRLRPDGQTDQTVTGELRSMTPATMDVRSFENTGEQVFGRIEVQRLPLEYFSGTLNNLELPIDSLSVGIERPPQGWQVLRPLDVEARLHVERGIGGVLDAHIEAKTWLLGEEIGSQMIDIEQLPLISDSMRTVPGLARLLADYPDQLTSHGNASLSGVVALFNNSVVTLGLEMRAGLAVVLTDTLSPIGKVERVDSQDLKDVVDGEAIIRVWNSLPIGGRVLMVAHLDSTVTADGVGGQLDTLYDVDVPWPVMENGESVEASALEVTIDLDQTWLDYFREDLFFVRTQLIVDAGIGDTLIANGRNRLSVQVIAKVVYTIRPGDIE